MTELSLFDLCGVRPHYECRTCSAKNLIPDPVMFEETGLTICQCGGGGELELPPEAQQELSRAAAMILQNSRKSR